MDITVIVCTFNRCQHLPKALESVAASVLPNTVQWEVLVVDNNSNDRTRDVIDEFCSRYVGRFRYVFESQPGLSHARNAGIREARGDILAFTDDDVTVEPTWLHNLTAALNSEEWAGSGGRTLPSQPFSPPNWLSTEKPFRWGGILGGLLDLGDKQCELGLAPFGSNMAFQKKMFEKYGEFRTDLGRRPGNLMCNEDTEFGRRLQAAGERLRYEPFAIVYHPILENRVQKEYFLAWWFDYGRSKIREVGIRPDLWGIPRRYISIPNNILRILPFRTLRWLVTSGSEQRFYRKCRVWMTAGEILEICRH